jgi:patatin-related protein
MAEEEPIDYASEIRFGVVMYGGVSLAIYINGVANEMYEMVSATPKFKSAMPARAGRPGVPHDTRDLYRRLAWLVGNPELRERYSQRLNARQRLPRGQPPADVWEDEWLDGLQPSRLVVDVIAGTSAGGINGIFLAKALTNGEPFSPLKDLWIQEGDIALLLNDKRSYHGLHTRDRSRHPESLLNGDRMYLKLFDTMQSMSARTRSRSAGSPLVDEMDLFVTTTDIVGSPVPLRLSDQFVYEKRHRQNFHFAHSTGGNERNDFTASKNALLAFAARCTSSFPFAFEPMTLASLKRLRPDWADAVAKDLPRVFSYVTKSERASGSYIWRAFGDGGYLDNKPFTYVAQTLSKRQAIVPVERKLIYVEPAPQAGNTNEAPGADTLTPDALSNSLAALSSIPRYEAIREDLQAILRRNRSIERVDRILREGETDLHQMLKGSANPFIKILQASGGKLPPWPEFSRETMATFYGAAFLAYRRVRVSSVTDRIARHLARHWDIDPASDHLYALTALVRVWRDRHYSEDPQLYAREAMNAFLDRYDIDYRIRRLSFLLSQIDHLKRLLIRRRQARLTRRERLILPEADKRNIRRLLKGRLNLMDPSLESIRLNRALAALDILKRQLNEAQANLRTTELRRSIPQSEASVVDDKLRPQLNAMLAVLLGERSTETLQLSMISGAEMKLRLTEKTLKACACERSMQGSVLVRARDLLDALYAAPEQPRLLRALEAGLYAIGRPNGPTGKSVWEILGDPELELTTLPGKSPQAVVKVKNVATHELNGSEATLLRCILGEHYVYFDLYDQMSFPLYHETNVGEPATVEVVRISPVDARNLIDETRDARRKLAGTAMHNFGAFLDRRWRLNDYMWGRLDGAERLIQTLLPMSDPATATVRAELIDEAHRRILHESLVRDGVGKVAHLLCQAIDEVRDEEGAVQRILDLIRRISPRQAEQHEHLADMLVSLLNEQSLLDYVRSVRKVDTALEPRSTLNNASRAVTITGRMLEEIVGQHGRKSLALRWVARCGLMVQGMLAVSLPGTVFERLRTHIMNLLYAVEILAVVFAMFLGGHEMRSLTVTAFIVTVTLHVMILSISDLMQSQTTWLRKTLLIGTFSILALAGLGSFSLYHGDWRSWLHDDAPGGKQGEQTARTSHSH